ncbi:MAG: protein-L-isoaspartate O-methyltransferase [Pseudomonadota bacterium]|jgi:protein-L-isoaspartate(D-aspartate) O-methyltransferase|nr:protein-L-isoaspartate O-methyltransferase [Pseudomonadota bacterium]
MPADAREQMIEHQVRAWDVLDERVLDTLRKVPREHFTPPQYRFMAYADAEVPLPGSQHMLRPSVVGRLLAALELTGRERVLEIGTGSGFVTACLSTLAKSVQSLEIVPELTDMARRMIGSMGLRDIDVVSTDALTFEPTGRFEAIAVTASMPVYDDRWQRSLSIGGRLFVVVGDAPVMEAKRIRRVAEDAWTEESLFETVIDPLVHAQRPVAFKF